MSRRLETKGSARRLAHQWVDLSAEKRRELLLNLDTESKIMIIENIVRIKMEREKNKNV